MHLIGHTQDWDCTPITPSPLYRVKVSDSNRLQEEYIRLVAGLRQAASQQDLVANPVLPKDILECRREPACHKEEMAREF